MLGTVHGRPKIEQHHSLQFPCELRVDRCKRQSRRTCGSLLDLRILWRRFLPVPSASWRTPPQARCAVRRHFNVFSIVVCRWDNPRKGVYVAPQPYKRHLGVCAIFSETTAHSLKHSWANVDGTTGFFLRKSGSMIRWPCHARCARLSSIPSAQSSPSLREREDPNDCSERQPQKHFKHAMSENFW